MTFAFMPNVDNMNYSSLSAAHAECAIHHLALRLRNSVMNLSSEMSDEFDLTKK